MNTNINQITEINGVMLSQKCMEQLRNFQENENSEIKQQVHLISRAISYISKRIYGRTPMQEDPEKDAYLISDLAFLQDFIENLSKPS